MFLLVFEKFNVNFDKDAVVYLCDESNVKIAPDLYGTIVTQFLNCNHFKIKIHVTSDVKDAEFHKASKCEFST